MALSPVFPRLCLAPVAATWMLLISDGIAQQSAASPNTVSLPLGNDLAIELVRIDPGTFQQGSPPDEKGRGADETLHMVAITRPFYLGKFPVTRGQFAAFVKETSYRTEAERGASGGFGFDGQKLAQRKDFTWKTPGFSQTDEHPVALVTFDDANAFLAWLSRKTGRSFALPSEAQWEYACRAGTVTAYPSGDDPATAGEMIWHKANADSGTRPVGRMQLNPWGLGDMLGNVWEWCADWYASYPDGHVTDPVQTDPNLSDKPRRVLRGGSWLKDLAGCRSATRYRNDQHSRNADNGFRVMTLDVTASAPAASGARAAEIEAVSAAAAAGSAQPAAFGESESPPDQSASRTAGSAVMEMSQQAKEGSFSLGILVVVGFVAMLVLALARIFRGFILGNNLPRGSSTGAMSMAAGGARGRIRTRPANDGFWIDSSLPIGTALICRYVVNGEQHEAEVLLDSASQFVFTGAPPSNISLVVEAEEPDSAFSGGHAPLIRNTMPVIPTPNLPPKPPRREERRPPPPPPAY